MDYKEIIAKIQKDAEAEVSRIKAEAKKKALQKTEETRKETKALTEKAAEEARLMRAEILSRRQTVAELDAKRLLLNAKQEIVDDVYTLAKAALHALPQTEYERLIAGMLKKCASDGDTVVVSAADEKVINKKFVDKVASEMGISLSIEKDDASKDGGIVLKGKSFDKNMTLSLEINAIKGETEADISKRLFE